jgi:hypothetical protein
MCDSYLWRMSLKVLVYGYLSDILTSLKLELLTKIMSTYLVQGMEQPR